MNQIEKTETKLVYVAPVAVVREVYLDQDVLYLDPSTVTIDQGSQDAGNDWFE